MFQSLNEILPKDVRQDRESEEVDVCDLWHKYANQAFLSKIINNHEAISFRDGILVISVEEMMFVDEIKAKERRIVKKINQELGENKVIKVKYR